MAGGQEVTTAQGDVGRVDFVRLRSRKTAVGGASASWPLSGQPVATSLGTVTYQFQPPISQDAEADWIYRSTGPGVTLAEDFRTDAAVNQYVGANGLTNAQTIAEGCITRFVEEDGTNCLKIRTPPNGLLTGRYWGKYLQSDWTNQFNGIGNSERWIQWRMKIPASRLVNPGPDGTGGWKCIIIGGRYNNTTNTGGSSMNSSHVITDNNYRGVPTPYVHSFEVPNGHDLYQRNVVLGGETVINLLPGFDRGPSNSNIHERYCVADQGFAGEKGRQGCPFWPVDTWFTLMIRIKIAAYSTTDTVPPGGNGNEYDVMWALPGDTQWTTIINARDYATGASPEFTSGPNSVILTTYETGRDIPGPETYVLYRQLICSTQEIPLPVAAATMPDWVPPSGEIGISSLNTISDVNPCPANNCIYSRFEKHGGLFAWCGKVYVPTLGPLGSDIFFGGGHDSYNGDEVYRHDYYTRLWSRLTNPYAGWVIGPSGWYTDPTTCEFYADAAGAIAGNPPFDCHPLLPHTYDGLHYIPAAHVKPWGIESNQLGYVTCAGSISAPGVIGKQRHFLDLDAMKWERIGDAVLGISDTPACYDSIRKALVLIANTPPTGASNRHWMLPVGTGVSRIWAGFGTGNALGGNGNLDHYRAADLLLRTRHTVVGSGFGPLVLTVFNALSPGSPLTPTLLGTGPTQVGGGEWVEEKRAYYYYEGFGSKTLFRLRPTGNPRTQPWQWESETMTFSGTVPTQYAPPNVPHYSRLRYMPPIKGFSWLASVGAHIHIFKPSTLL